MTDNETPITSTEELAAQNQAAATSDPTESETGNEPGDAITSTITGSEPPAESSAPAATELSDAPAPANDDSAEAPAA